MGAPDAAQRYDWECRHVLGRRDQDVAFWGEAAAKAEGPVLELACGTGRLTFPLARAGIAVVGVDNDPVMLRAAQREREQAQARARAGARGRADGRKADSGPWPLFLAADMRNFALAGRFALVFVGYNSLQLLIGPGEMGACLSRARQHLTPGGLVGVEVTDFQAGGADGPDAGDWEPLGEAEGMRLSGTLAHDLGTRTSRYRRRFVGDGWAIDDEVVVRSVDRAELRQVLDEAGLHPVRWWETGTTVRALASSST
jgi:SAM-dependent methyltransferase